MRKWLVAFFVLMLSLAACTNASDDKEKAEKDQEAKAEAKKEASEPPVGMKVPVQIVDQSSENQDVANFISALKEVVNAKDAEKLIKMVSDDVKYSFGNDDGKKGFIGKWKLSAQPEQSDIWLELSDVLALGGIFTEDDTFVMPSFAASFPEEFDRLTYGVLIGEEVNMRTNPDINSEVAEQLTNEVIKVGEPTESVYEMNGRQYKWIEIETTLGNKGYVVEKFVRKPSDYRIELTKTDAGQWQITAFIEGD